MNVMLRVTIPILCINVCQTSSYTNEELTSMPGHLKEFGFTEKRQPIPEIEGFPFSKAFFEEYVHGSKPVIMKSAAKLSPAFSKWTDDYFLSLDEPADHEILVEMKKKENRSEPATHMSFKDYVRIYNNTDQYMVNGIPPMIQHDVILPGPLQCEPIEQKVLVDAVMWFSSGGTKSVVHTDSVDNINCLYRGDKTLVMVDPEKFADKVDLDHPEGAYSSIDVDAVDFTKFPDLADVDYYHVDMKPGDCLYIPYKWIHQVRSYGSNLAVNVWWDHHLSKEVDLDQCPDHFDPEFTMDTVELMGFDSMPMTGETIREHFLDFTSRGAVDFTGTLRLLVQDYEGLDQMDRGKGYQAPIRKIFELLDTDGDGLATSDEVEMIPEEGWNQVLDYMDVFDDIVASLEQAMFELHGPPSIHSGAPGDVSGNDASESNARIEL